MSRDGRMVATLSPCGHRVPDDMLEYGLGDGAVFSAPPQLNQALTEVSSVVAHNAQAPLDRFRGSRGRHRVLIVRRITTHLAWVGDRRRAASLGSSE
jgi:hypothetical protein